MSGDVESSALGIAQKAMPLFSASGRAVVRSLRDAVKSEPMRSTGLPSSCIGAEADQRDPHSDAFYDPFLEDRPAR